MDPLRFILLVWMYFAGSVGVGLLFGKVLAHGGPDGRRGIGHICSRIEQPSTFWMTIGLNAAIALLIIVMTDGFGAAPGLSGVLGWTEPLQDRP